MSGPTLIKLGSWNVQSLTNKCDTIMEHLQDRDVDIVFLTETWLVCQNSDITRMVKDYGYNMLIMFFVKAEVGVLEY